jgi:acid phosphatase family membrane protein YuiD
LPFKVFFIYFLKNLKSNKNKMKRSLPVFIIPLSVGLTLQIIKIVVDFIKWEKITFFKIFAAGWFPSVHSGLSTSILTVVGYNYWIWSMEFAVVLIFSLLFWYDAANVRYQAWEHAKVINNLRKQLSNLLVSVYPDHKTLKERLGHTVEEVIWWILISLILTLIILKILSFYQVNLW